MIKYKLMNLSQYTRVLSYILVTTYGFAREALIVALFSRRDMEVFCLRGESSTS